MDRLYSGIINEILKLYRRRTIKIFVIINIIIAVCSSFILSAFQYKIGIFAITASTLPVIILGLFTDFFLPLFVIALSSDVFSGEEGSRTMKLTLVRPISRFKVFISKYIAVIFYIALSLISIFLASVITLFFMHVPGNSSGSFMANLGAYLAAVFPQAVLASFAIFIAQFFKNSGGSMVSALVVYIAARLITFILPKASRVFFTSYMNWHAYWHSVTLFLLVLSYGIIFLTCGYYIFDKKDF